MHKRTRLWALVGLFAALSIVAAACSSGNDNSSGSSGSTTGGASGSSGGSSGGTTNLSGELNGAGSSAQQAAQTAWIATFTGNYPDLTINYDPSGSGAGREQFEGGGVDFAGSDAYLADDELTKAQQRCGGNDNVIELPVYISPIAVAFNVSGVDSLNLSPDVIAKIFTGAITKWNDPAIAQLNQGETLPDTTITPVHRSDDSGTTQNFTEYLSAAAPDVWKYPPDDTWPIKGGESAEGTSGVVDAVTNGDGTITYADASQTADLGNAKVEVNGEFVEHTADAASAVIDSSTPVSGRGPYDHAIDVNRTPKGSEYPIVLLSYELACTQYDDPQTAANVKGYLSYMVSAEGQQLAAQNAGSAPISDELRQEAQTAIDAIQT
jgi:phosphate transport system substrate-binding protein